MAVEYTFEELQGDQTPSDSPEAAPSQGWSFEELTGGGGAAPKAATNTPATDAAMAAGTNAWEKIIAAAKKPSPEWLQPGEKMIRDVATYQIPGVAETSPIYWMGKYAQTVAPLLPESVRPAVEQSGRAGIGLAKGIASMATPMNVGLALLNPPSAAGRTALAGLFTAQAAAGTPEKLKQIQESYGKGDTGAVTQEVAELAGSYLPAAHFVGGRGAKAKAEPKVEPPIPPPGTEGVIVPPSQGPSVAAEGKRWQQDEAGNWVEVKELGTTQTIKHRGKNYRFDEASDTFHEVDDHGKVIRTVEAEEGGKNSKLVEALNAKLDELASPEAKTEAMDVADEARAKKLMTQYKNLAGEPLAVLQDMTDQAGGKVPTWGEFADELQGEVTKLTKTPEKAQLAYTEGLAKRRGIPVEQIEMESAARESARVARTLNEIKDASLSRKEIEAEKEEAKKGGKYAPRVKSPGPLSELEIRTLMGKEAPLRGKPEGASGAGAQPRPTGPSVVSKVPKAEPRDLELLNRARHNVELEHKLPKNPVELLKRQEDDMAPTNEEIQKLVDFEYHKLLREKRAAIKKSEAVEKPTAPAPKEIPGRSHLPVQSISTIHSLGTKSGKPGLRETILNAREKGLTVEQFRKWREGTLDLPMDADSVAARKKALGIKEEPPEEPPAAAAPAVKPKPPTEPTLVTGKKKTFKVRTSLDDYANSPETPVATAVSNLGGVISKSAAQKAGKYEGNAAQWDDAPKMSHPTHNKIYSPSGEMPDVMAQSLHERGLIEEPTANAMNRALERESAGIRRRSETEKTEEKAVGGQVKQAEKFGQGQRQEIESGTAPVAAEALSIGDKVKVDNTELKVTGVDPDGTVTLEDGKRYGVQEVAGDELIYGEVEPQAGKTAAEIARTVQPEKPATAPAAPEERFSTKKNFKKIADGRYEHKDSKLIISKGKESGWDIRHPTTGEVIDNQPTRQKAMQAYAEGQTTSVTEQASKLRLRANKEGGFVNAEILKEVADLGKRLYQKGMSYGRWAKDMVAHLGEKVRQHLKTIWDSFTGKNIRPGFRESGEVGRTGGLRGFGKNAKSATPESYGKTMAAANDKLTKNPSYADQLVKDLTSGKKVNLDTADEAVLVQHKAALQGLRKAAAKTMKNKQLPEDMRREAATNFQDLDAQLRDLDVATGDGSYFKDRQQARMWHNFKARDYSQEAVEEKMMAAKGGIEATREQKAFIARNVDRLSDMMTKIGFRKAAIGWRPGLSADRTLRNMQYDAFRAKENLDNLVFKETIKHKAKWERALRVTREITSIPRALMASMDLSAVLRQGGILFVSHPIRALKAMPDMLRAAKNNRAYFDLMQDIRERPNAQLYIQSKLGLTDVASPKLSQLEEQYMSQWANAIPLVAHSQRAYVYYLNRLRADSFDAMARTVTRNGVPTPKQAMVISNFINVFTGRGAVPGKASEAIAMLNNLFFAPRYTLSRFQALTAQPLRYAFRNDPTVAKLVATEYARALAGYAVVYGLVGTALKDQAKVEWDWRSTDFGKIRIGNTRIDIMAGLAQPTVFMVRSAPEILGLGKTKNARGQIMPLGGQKKPFSERSYTDVLQDFVRTKFAPLPAAYVNVKMGKKVTGETTDLGSELWGMVTPMSGKDIAKGLEEWGLPKGAALGMLAIFGANVQTYADRATAPARTRHRTRPSR